MKIIDLLLVIMISGMLSVSLIGFGVIGKGTGLAVYLFLIIAGIVITIFDDWNNMKVA